MHELMEYDRSLQYWARFLSTKPDRTGLTTAFYFIGECQNALGNLDAAKNAYREAVDVGIETLHSRLARERLEESNPS